MKDFIAIGDVHGLTRWKVIVNDHPDCHIVFLGDYLDPYEESSNEDIIRNLLDIIQLKQQRPDDVMLLLGNHDLHYFVEEMELSSRFNMEIAADVSEIFRSNYHLVCLCLSGRKLRIYPRRHFSAVVRRGFSWRCNTQHRRPAE